MEMISLGKCYVEGVGVAKDFKQGMVWFEKAKVEGTRQAEAGVVEGMDALGCIYLRGYGVMPDYKEALKWLKRAAEAGIRMR